MVRTYRGWIIGGLIALGVFAVLFMAQTSAMGLHFGSFAGLFSVLAVLFTALFWVAIIGGGIWLAMNLTSSDSSVAKHLGSRDKSLSTLRERYARGEINRAEYFQMKQDLESE